MALSPQITLTATFQDMTGAAIGNAANPCKMRIDLCGFGQTIPAIVGTSVVAQIEKEILSTTGSFSTLLWGNDVISPNETFYQITVIDAFGRVIQAGIYSFSGTEAIDLSNAQQLISGVIDLEYTLNISVSTSSATVPNEISIGSIPMLFYNGQLKVPGIGYAKNGNTFNFLDFTAENGDVIYIRYRGFTLYPSGYAPPLSSLTAYSVQIETATTAITVPGTIAEGSVSMLFYNGQLKVPGIGYSVSGGTFSFIDFTAEEGDNVYVLYVQAL